MRIRGAIALVLIQMLLAVWHGTSLAQNTIDVGIVAAGPGEQVVVPISATTDQPVTLLSLDIMFDPSLCGLVDSQMVVQAGRSEAEPQEDAVRCPEEGRVRIVAFDLVGDAVVPPGAGVIFEWTFDIRADAPEGSFPLTVTVNQASNGPINVALVPSDGELTITDESIATATPPILAPTVTPTLPLQPSPSPHPSATPSPTPTTTVEQCIGDCDRNGMVTIDELIRGVNIALGSQQLVDCPAFDRDGDRAVSVSELIAAANMSLNGCEPRHASFIQNQRRAARTSCVSNGQPRRVMLEKRLASADAPMIRTG